MGMHAHGRGLACLLLGDEIFSHLASKPLEHDALLVGISAATAPRAYLLGSGMLGRAHLAYCEQPTRGVGSIDLAPFLVE
jgi:hypothetical protein